MTTYASVGVRRIQTHLARTRSLWGRRGASDQLWDLTQLPEPEDASSPQGQQLPRHQRGHGALVAQVLQQHLGVEVNREALDIDGEIPIQGPSLDQVCQAAECLAQRIQERQPAVEVVVRIWADQDSYPATLAAPAQQQEYLPAIREYPPVRTCEECQTDAVSHQMPDSAKTPPGLRGKWLCHDCFHRTTMGRHDSLQFIQQKDEQSDELDDLVCWDLPGDSDRPDGLRVEAWLLTVMNQNRNQNRTSPLGYLRNFDELARVPALSTDPERRTRTYEDNHTALVFADANGLGGIFGKLRRKAANDEQTMRQLTRLSKGVKQATGKALIAATTAVTDPSDTKLAVIPHLLGGDDLLVSLPATRVWPFVRELMSNLHQQFEEHVDPFIPEQLGLPKPSVSAAVLISQLAFPFGLQVDLVEQLLQQAKRHGLGRQWTLSWQDVTHEGVDLVDRTPWDWQELTSRRPALDYLTQQLTGSAVGALRADLADEDLFGAGLKLEYRSRRLAEVKQLLKDLGIETVEEDEVRLLRDVLVLGRWWR